MGKQKNIKSQEDLENTPSDEKTISVKFNKEVKEISLEEAKAIKKSYKIGDKVSNEIKQLLSEKDIAITIDEDAKEYLSADFTPAGGA